MKTRNSRAFCILFAAWVFFGIINSGVAQEQGLKNTDTARRLIVKVEGENSTDFGSGIIVGERAGYLFIVTAKHLRGGELKRTERFNVTFEFTRALLPMKAEFVEDDPNRDLTIPRVNGEKLTEQREESNPLYQNRYTGIDKLHTGDAVYPIGIPLGSEWFIPTIPWKVQKVVGENIYIQ